MSGKIQNSMFLQFLKHPFSTGAVCASSPSLCGEMVGCPCFRNARSIAELGPGTGAVTECILSALPAGADFFAVVPAGETEQFSIFGNHQSLIAAIGAVVLRKHQYQSQHHHAQHSGTAPPKNRSGELFAETKQYKKHQRTARRDHQVIIRMQTVAEHDDCRLR